MKATVTAATSTSLSATVPAGATYQPITVTDLTIGLTAYSTKPFTVTFPSSRVIDANSFAVKVDFTTGGAPWDVKIGDLDGDGKPDLAVTNSYDNTVSLLRNTGTSGSASFAAKVDFTTGTYPHYIAIGDMGGDGKLDLSVTNWNDSTVSVLRNTGTSGNVSFAAKVDFPTGEYTEYFAIGDIDRDGKPDLTVVNAGAVSVLRNTGTSGSVSFAAKVDFATGSGPDGVAIGDLDGDGKPDLAVTNWNDNTVSVLRNTGTSGSVSFAAKVDFPTGKYPNYIAIGDMDGDGKPDLAVTNQGNNTVSVLRNTGTSGSVSFAANVNFPTGADPNCIAMGDIDGDGRPDLAVVNFSDSTVSVLRNTGTSGSVSFAAKVDFPTGLYTGRIAIGDIDGDGKPDLAVVNAGAVSVLRNLVGGSNAAPAAPQNLTATAGNGQVTLKWSRNTESDFLRYRIYGGTSSSPTTKIDSTTGSISDTTRTVGGLTNGTIYYFRITAVDSAGLESGYSNEVSATPSYVPLPGEYTADANTVLLLHMDETSGSTVIDASSYGNNGTATGTTIVDGRFGKARIFDGGNNSIQVPSNSSLNFSLGKKLTAEAWIRIDNFTSRSGQIVGVNVGVDWSLNILPDGRIEWNIYNGLGTYTTLRSRIQLKRFEWHHIAGAWNGNNGFAAIFVDGVVDSLVGDAVGSLVFTNTSSEIGAFFSGIIDEIRMSNMVRQPEEFNLQLQPKNLSATVSGTTVGLGWQNGGGAVPLMRYKIYRGKDSTSLVLIDSTTHLSYNNSGLALGTYYYRASAVDSTGFEGAKSFAAQATVVTTNSPPAPPQNLAATAGNAQVTLRWNKNTESDFLRYRIYGGTSSSPTIKMDSTVGGISDTTKTIPSLTNGTIYYFRITAVDSAGLESDFSNEVSARPVSTGTAAPTVSTSAATSITMNSAVLNGTVNPNGSATTVYFEWGTGSTLSSPTVTPSQSVGSGGTDQIVTANLTGLNPATTYYYCVVGDNNIGTRRGAIANFTTVPAAVSLSSPSNGATNQLQSLSLSWTASTGAAKYHLQVSTSTSFNTAALVVDDSILTTTSRQIGPMSFGTTYYWRVCASNSTGASPYSAVYYFITIPAPPTTVGASVTFHFPQKSNPGECAATDYRLVGIPGNINQEADAILGGTPHTDWDIYWDNGNANNFFNKYDGGTQFKFTTGRAFWIISKGDVSIDRTVPAAPMNSSYQAEIPLHAGWNLITNPFGSSVLWSKIQSENDISTGIHTYNNGTFAAATSFDPNVGYYFFNGTPNPSVLTILKISYQSIFTKVAEVPESKPDGWRVNIELNVNGIIDGTTQFGISQLAKPALDKYDVRKPRTVSIVPEIFFDRKEWDEQYPSFSTDIRSSIQEAEKWTFTVKSEPRKPATITFKGIDDVPQEYEVFLVDRAQAKFIDLRQDSKYIFTPVICQTDYTVVVGKKDAVLKEVKEIIPTEFALGQNFPNPFNPTTSFSVRLPVSSFVTVTVFNILGQPVRSVYSGNLEAGQHWFTWDGRNEIQESVPSGVYYCRLDVAGVKSFVTKMVMIK